MTEEYDFVIVGSGPSGHKAAVTAAEAGKRVLVIEREPTVGGACVHQGTIPSKTLRETALAFRGAAVRAGQQVAAFEEGVEVASLMTRLHDVVRMHARHIASELADCGVDVWHGHARFLGPNELQVQSPTGKKRVARGDKIVLAVGTRPRSPVGVSIDHEHVLDSDSILSLTYLPRSLIVLGGGVVASEYASLFAELGVKVTMLDPGPRPMPFLDPELTSVFLDGFVRRGGAYFAEQNIATVRYDGGAACTAALEDGTTYEADKVLCALGRVANVEGLGLSMLGLTLTSRGLIEVNEHCQTASPHVYAVGDVIGAPSLASTSMEQGRRAVRHALGISVPRVDSSIPFCGYTIPELASVGLSESDATRKYGGCLVGRAAYADIARARIGGHDVGLMKLIAAPDGKTLVGVQIVGHGASELIHVGQMALLGGLTVDHFVEATLNFPTLAEGYRIAALDLMKKRGPET